MMHILLIYKLSFLVLLSAYIIYHGTCERVLNICNLQNLCGKKLQFRKVIVPLMFYMLRTKQTMFMFQEKQTTCTFMQNTTGLFHIHLIISNY